ncbi:MFS transporter [Nocardia sp. SYP-A9097]|uniref:MFS transporter n=1 Tax=Nocardia sp. SYP-A9097 TaxID=2663237 RepID=UPI00129C043A|nr:MFS transporter [Nocardia sp. SYP-A9097]MRH88370.1 MFS transporter [Nocardia sp. SYP-A9097]
MKATAAQQEITEPAGPEPGRRTRGNGASYEHPAAFRIGVGITTIGVLLQLPMFYSARDMHYQLAGMPLTHEMTIGMALILLGIACTFYSLFPRRKLTGTSQRISITPLDDAPITSAHIALLAVIAVAITIDVMKPVAFAFLTPGAANEYGLRGPLHPHADAWPVGLYPLAGIGGTMIGSFLWGWLGDRIGRRASILLSAVIFIATSCCGTMPEFWMNLVTCFVMGLGVGGMLPITFTLLSETVPRRHRGWMMVLIGSDIAGAYIIVSWLSATWASPEHFGWRLLWLIGLPTGLILLLLNRWIPESPRFLLQQGRIHEAHAVMRRYGAHIVETESEPAVEQDPHGGSTRLFTRAFLGLSAAVVLLAVSIGTTQYGFQQWMPSNLQRLGFSETNASTLLRNAAILGFPFSVPVALLYGFWSSKKTVILVSAVMSAALAAFAILGDHVVDNRALLYVLLVIPVWGISILNSVLAAYTAEVYPTVIRARGSGLSAGATKAGGVFILATVVMAIAAPSVRATAALGVIPLTLAIVALIAFGPETRHRQLESIGSSRPTRLTTK